MKSTTVIVRTLLALLCLAWIACDEEDDPATDQIGGETNLELTEVGGTFGMSLGTGTSIPGMENLQDSITITRNDNGNVTVHVVMRFDSTFVRGLEQALGISDLPENVKHTVIDVYAKRFSATLDTTDKRAMRATADLQFRVTSEGIQEYVSSRGDLSKPFTIVRYNANVGDKYESTNAEGVKVTRTVSYKSTTDDYPVGFWLFKVLKVEETKEDLLIEKITYVANHKYGLLGVQVKSKDGKEIQIGVFPPTL